MARMTKAQKQDEALRYYIQTSSSLPSYACFCKVADKKMQALFTASTFPRYYYKYKGIDTSTKEGKDIVKAYKTLSAGDFDLDSVSVKDDGIYIRKFGEKEAKLVYGLGHLKSQPKAFKIVRDAKSNFIVAKDYIVDFDLPIARKMHLYVTSKEAHIRYSYGYLAETYKSKRQFKIED